MSLMNDDIRDNTQRAQDMSLLMASSYLISGFSITIVTMPIGGTECLLNRVNVLSFPYMYLLIYG